MKNLKKTVLLVEDDEAVRAYLSDVLKKNGFDVVEASDGKEGCERYEEHEQTLDVIVSDLRMPNMNGVRFAEYNYDKHFFPFVVCTAIEDTKLSLELMEYGVQDYIVKPVNVVPFVVVVNSAINRRYLSLYVPDEKNPYSGNVGSVTIPSKWLEIYKVNNWIRGKLDDKFDVSEVGRFISYVREFLINAHEHGNLKINEDEKHELIKNGSFIEEIKTREEICNAKIRVDLSVLPREVSVKITDDGFGFDHDKYLRMSETEMFKRLEMFNGRGINMANKYFNSISYSKGGASVLLNKKFK